MAVTPGCSCDDDEQTLGCDAGDDAWVERALLAINGRRASSQAEVDVHVNVLRQLRDEHDLGPLDARAELAQALYRHEGFRERWSEFMMDSLEVLRTPFVRIEGGWNVVQATRCYGPELTESADGGALAAYVRDASPLDQNPPWPKFTLGRVMSSALLLDDMRPIYRAQLFHMMAFPLAAPNLTDIDRERERRHDFGRTFESVYLHRDPECLECHNATEPYSSPSDIFPLANLSEAPLYGMVKPPTDLLSYRSMFRVMDVHDPLEGQGAWGWDEKICGAFKLPASNDPLGVNTSFGTIRGSDVSVFTLDLALKRGFDLLLTEGAAAHAGDPDANMAYLVSANIAERVWEEVIGSPLTIANFYPRNAQQRDLLQALTDKFVTSGYSLKTLLTEIVLHPLFNLPTPDGSCDAEPYSLPPVLDPFSTNQSNVSEQGNSAADRVFPMRSRALQYVLHRAMGWPAPQPFPADEAEETVHSSLGLFLSSNKPGFHGLDFQARLSWESVYGACRHPELANDFITGLSYRAASDGSATVEDAVIALKDRLIGEPYLDDSERAPLEQMLGQPLATPAPAATDLEGGLRAACGAYLMSPQFLLVGASMRAPAPIPRLTDQADDFGNNCARLAAAFDAAGLGHHVSCGADSLEVIER
jgi:hypothetical protein